MKNNLKSIIYKKGYDTKKLAKEIEVSEQTITNWNNGRKTKGLYIAYKLCKALNINISELFED